MSGRNYFLKIDAVLDPRKFPLQVVKRVPSAFDNADWLFEIKHDGFRVLAIRDGSLARLYTRNGYDISRRHQHVTAALAAFPTERFVLDGELVVLDDDGRSNFPKLARGRTGTHYYAFDLLRFSHARDISSSVPRVAFAKKTGIGTEFLARREKIEVTGDGLDM